MFTLRSIGGALFSAFVYGLLLFLPAWTLNWWRAWALLGGVFVSTIVTRFWVFRNNEGLLEERRKPPLQEGQPRADKLLVVAFLVVFPAYIAFIPLDVFRFHLFEKPGAVISLLGLILCIAGWLTISLAFRENAFAVPIVKHQEERKHAVIDTGVYGVVRHPLYSGVVLILVGIALWLQSYAAAILSVIPIAVLVLRIVVEEDFLMDRLSGYDAYAKRVAHRVIPRVW
jgi:protein-S-isoprenylcysteine O-methyltransferase Ste14